MKRMSLSWLMVIALASFHVRAQECPLPPLPALQQAFYSVSGVTVGVPPAWKTTVQEFSTGVHVADATSGCRLEVSRVQEMTPSDALALHEKLYWGTNQLSGACLASMGTRLASAGRQAFPGQYEPRLFGYKFLVVVRALEGNRVELLTLRCPRAKAGWLSWAWLVAIADSLTWKETGN